jgi:hypothetical protein
MMESLTSVVKLYKVACEGRCIQSVTVPPAVPVISILFSQLLIYIKRIMESFLIKPTIILSSLSSVMIVCCSLSMSWLLLGAIYRLYWIPLARITGPRLAALTFWYEFYFDVVKKGQYTFKIKELHERYGRCSWQSGICKVHVNSTAQDLSSVSIHMRFIS